MNRRILAVVLVSMLVVLAGCSGGGPGAESGDGAGDGNGDVGDAGSNGDTGDDGASDGAGGSSDGDGPSSGSIDSGEWEPFQFDQPGRYEYEVFMAGEGEGTLVWEVTSVSEDEFSAKITYDVGGQSYESEITGDRETVQQQMMMSPAGSLMMLTIITPGAWYSGRDLEVGTQWSYQTQEGSGSFEITGTKTIGGVSCFTSEMKVNGSVVHAGCFSPDHGMAPHSAYYNEEGELQMEMTLVSYERSS